MASRENQSLQIALMVFALLTVVLAVTTYIGFKQYGDQRKENENLNTRLSDNQSEVRKSVTEQNRFKEMMGFSIDDELVKIDELFKADFDEYAKKYGVNLPEEEHSYKRAAEYLGNDLKDIRLRETAARQREQSLKDKLAKVQGDAGKQIQEYQAQMEAIKKDKDGEAATFDQQRAGFKKQTAEMTKQLDQDRKELANLQASKETQVSLLKDKVGKIERQLFRVSKEKEQIVAASFEVADGKVARVNQGSKTIWINLGSRDGLMPRVMFSVYDADDNNAATATKKAGVEVTQILGPHLAEARIVSDTVSNPMVRGDQIYSPIWHRGRAESFAISGFIDLDGDGESDLEQVRDLVQINGGVIDAEIGDDGSISGKMTVNTRYLVKGEQPKAGKGPEKDDLESIKAAAETYSRMESEANNLGIEKISVAEFLDRMGWRAPNRTVRLGRSADPNQFLAEPSATGRRTTSVAPSEQFRRRRPPRVTF